MPHFRRASLLAAALACLLAACSPQPAERPGAGGSSNRDATMNHLAGEASPYLQRHARNPVDWYPWGAEAFEKAKREDKPIFLSIGYSTCHWCHVMEAESFENAAIAAVINEHFVAVKVDREERPDVDRVYLAYVTSVSNAGWPMTLLLTPDLKPFFGATYMPPETRGDQEGLRPALERLSASWTRQRAAVLKAAAAGSSLVDEMGAIPKASAGVLGVTELDETFESMSRSFDTANGGFGGAPKFPRPVALTFLLRHYARTGAQAALDMVGATLRGMRDGAIHDRLEGGFHRYTVDAGWRVPHFEKMLYDQALIAAVAADAWQASRDPQLAAMVHETLGYVLTRLRDANGGFYSAEDADSAVGAPGGPLEEGAFYVWTLKELQEVLGGDAALAAYHFGVTEHGTPGLESGLAAANALAVRHSLRETAAHFGTTETAAAHRLDSALDRLRQRRALRPRPALDDKIITSWNGLTITALARAAVVFDDRRYLDAAAAAARFVESTLFDARTGMLERRYRAGAADVDGMLDDYAFFVQGLLDLFEATTDPHWLELALRLQETQDRLFWDDRDGGYFSTSADAAHLIARMKEDYDGAEPAGSSVAAMNLVRFWQLTDADAWRERADATFRALSGRAARSGTAVPQLMAALDFRRAKAKQIVIAGDPSAADTRALLRLVHARFIPNKVVAVVDGGARQAAVARLMPPLADMTMRNGRATIYVCENFTCNLPTTDPDVAARLLN